MAKKHIFWCLIFALLFCGCNKNEGEKVINIAVTGSPSAYSEYYESGVKKAYTDVCEEYKDSGFEINVKFYDDYDNYETADKITAELVNDNSVTAIIASSSAEICENQVYQTDKAGKILICPHWLYDSTLKGKNYRNVFSLNYSNEDVGAVMKKIAKESSAKRWAICYAEDEISTTEIKCFNKVDSNIDIVDSVKINTFESSFSQVVDRWKLLGVEGVILIPYEDEGFNLLYRLKEKMPELYVISDSSMDDDNELQANKKYFDNMYMVESFFVSSDESKIFKEGESDTWEIHGYNSLRIIVDTAIKNNTNIPEKIAEALHKTGYVGELENFKFNEDGTLYSEIFNFVKIINGEIIEYNVPKK